MAPKDRESADDRPVADRSRGGSESTTPEGGTPLTELKPGQARSSDEAGDVSTMNADHPMRVREETTDGEAAGLPVDDEARGELLKKQLKDGMTNVRPMD